MSIPKIRFQRCPDCDQNIEPATINIKEGFALCNQCGRVSQLDELVYSDYTIQEILDNPPPGCTIESSGQSVTLTASVSSLGGSLAAIAFALFWNGIVLIFVVMALAGLYANLVGPLPAWFPLPGKVIDGKPVLNDGPLELNDTLYLCAFLLPFLLVGIAAIAAAIMCWFGKVEIVIDERGSHISTGVGFIRWKRRFDARQVRAVNHKFYPGDEDGGPSQDLELIADWTVKTGAWLEADKTAWIRAVLRELLLYSSKSPHQSNLPKLNWIPRKHNMENESGG